MPLSLRPPAIRGGIPTIEQAQARVTDAEQAVQDAEDSWRAAILANEAGDCTPADVEAAEAALASARAAQTRAEAILEAAYGRAAAEASAANKAARNAQDALALDAFDKMTKAAKVIEKAARTYATAYDELIEAANSMRGAVQGNPRVRSDLLQALPVKRAVALELVRAGGTYLPPGASSGLLGQAPQTITPISKAFADLASLVRAELGHAE